MDGALNIGKAAATVTANSNSVTYNGLTQSVTGFTASGLVNGELATVLTGVTTTGGSGTNAGSYTHTASGLDSNYTLSFVDGALNIGKAALVVAANDATRVQGSVNSSFSSIITGFVNGETSAVLTGVLDHSTPATVSSIAGNYAITPFGVSVANYTISFVDGILNVTPFITPPPPPPSATNLSALNGPLTRPEKAVQTCIGYTKNEAMMSGLGDYGVDDVEYKQSVSQPLVGNVVANALLGTQCLKL